MRIRVGVDSSDSAASSCARHEATNFGLDGHNRVREAISSSKDCSGAALAVRGGHPHVSNKRNHNGNILRHQGPKLQVPDELGKELNVPMPVSDSIASLA